MVWLVVGSIPFDRIHYLFRFFSAPELRTYPVSGMGHAKGHLL